MKRGARRIALLFGALICASLFAGLASAALEANAGQDQSVVVGTKVVLDGTRSTAGSNYTWSFSYNGQNTKLYGVEPSFYFNRTGWYEVTLNVSSGDTWATDQVVINVTANNAATTSLIYSGSAALVVAVLLVGLFFAMRKRTGTSAEDDADSEEEFEDIAEEAPAKINKS